MLKKNILFFILPFLLFKAVLFGANSDIRLNSIGYLPSAEKRASIIVSCSNFNVRRASDSSIAFSGTVTGPVTDPESGQNIRTAAFTSLTETGTFYLEVPGVGQSVNFTISDTVYNFAYYTVMRAFYFFRCGTAVSGTFNGQTYSHAACHMNDAYLDYVGGGHTIRDGKGGWHDAGDYNKYIVNAGITVGMMFKAWELYKDVLQNISLDIPNTATGYPDYLKEMKWEIDWVLKMAYSDGSGKVSAKLSALDFDAFEMPEQETANRFFTDWGSAATADYVAMLAMAARIFAPYDVTYANQCLTAATTAYNFLLVNTANKNPDYSAFLTGGYGTSDSDDRLWAAAEMWETTGSTAAHQDFTTRANNYSDKTDTDWDWSEIRNLGMYTYLLSTRTGKNTAINSDIQNDLISDANTLVTNRNNHGYGRPLGTSYYWGCNGSVARTALNLLIANKVSPNSNYVQTALDAINHIFGRNYYNRSYVTGLGINPPMNPHHRPSGADGITNPWPGYIVGGGHSYNGWQDIQDSYETNEVAINWQGALVFALAAFAGNPSSPTFTPTITRTMTGTPPTVTFTLTYTQTPTFTPIRVNCGGSQYNDGTNVWLADQAWTSGGWGYVNGTAGTTTDTINGTIHDVLYQSERYNAAIEYRFTVPNGQYQVSFKFVEMYFNTSGSRIFSVSIEGNSVINNLDVFSIVGHDTAYDSGPFIVTVTDGILNITASATANNAQFCAIEILQFITGTPTFTRTPTFTITLTGTVTRTASPSYTRTQTFTATYTVTSSSTHTYTNTRTVTPTFTWTDTISSNTPTITQTRTKTLMPTLTSTNSLLPTNSFTPTMTVTQTLSWTLTRTPTITISSTHSISPTITWTWTGTPPTLTFTPTITNTSTITLTFTKSPTFTCTFTETYMPTNTFTNTNQPTFTRTMTLTFDITGQPTMTFTFTATLTPEQPDNQQLTGSDVIIYPNPYSPDKQNLLRITFMTKPGFKKAKIKIYSIGYRLIEQKEEQIDAKDLLATIKIENECFKNKANGVYYILLGITDNNTEIWFKPEELIILR
ncbi:MAG: glycoside hydrolase family 9 protein [Candidatus Goldbacteria bacterium]|nr:glycoside hydrolase family 9 protein [Candidatus Goldiibacteriota bacterium]